MTWKCSCFARAYQHAGLIEFGEECYREEWIPVGLPVHKFCQLSHCSELRVHHLTDQFIYSFHPQRFHVNRVHSDSNCLFKFVKREKKRERDVWLSISLCHSD